MRIFYVFSRPELTLIWNSISKSWSFVAPKSFLKLQKAQPVKKENIDRIRKLFKMGKLKRITRGK